MKTIYKYPLLITDSQTLAMPDGAELLAVQIQFGEPHLWAKVDPRAPVTSRKIRTFGTGHTIPDDVGPYIGTYQVDGGALVFHVFEGE